MQSSELFLFDYEIEALQSVLENPEAEESVRRHAEAILLYADGTPIEVIAEQLEIPLAELERFIHRFRIRLDLPPLQRLELLAYLTPYPRKTLAAIEIIHAFHNKNPNIWRLPLSRWNMSLVRKYLEQRGIHISRETLRTAARRAAKQRGYS